MNESKEDEKPHITFEEVKNCIGKPRTSLEKHALDKKLNNLLVVEKDTLKKTQTSILKYFPIKDN